jgi:hypothetical protein
LDVSSHTRVHRPRVFGARAVRCSLGVRTADRRDASRVVSQGRAAGRP